ncbi:MAG: hypothetical protein QM752_05325 [Gammaproteobacteria bacterium]
MNRIIQKEALQAQKMIEKLSFLVGEVFSDSTTSQYYPYDSPGQRRLSAINEEVAAVRVYVNDIVERLERREFWRGQLRFAATMAIGIIVGMVMPHIVLSVL